MVYLDLSPFVAQVQQTLALCKDSVEVASPQGRYRVQRYVYRATVQLKVRSLDSCVQRNSLVLLQAQALIGASGGGGSGPGGIDVIHSDWEGQLVVETEGKHL